MRKLFKAGQPVARGSRSSVVHWDLTIRFTVKEQLVKFTNLLVKEEINYNFEVEMINAGSSDEQWELTIYDMCWANNLTRISKLLDRVDYNC